MTCIWHLGSCKTLPWGTSTNFYALRSWRVPSFNASDYLTWVFMHDALLEDATSTLWKHTSSYLRSYSPFWGHWSMFLRHWSSFGPPLPWRWPLAWIKSWLCLGHLTQGQSKHFWVSHPPTMSHTCHLDDLACLPFSPFKGLILLWGVCRAGFLDWRRDIGALWPFFFIFWWRHPLQGDFVHVVELLHCLCIILPCPLYVVGG